MNPSLTPDACDRVFAESTSPIFHVPFQYFKSYPSNDNLAAARAVCMLPLMAEDIAKIHIL
jgi:hypothetical protein